MTASVNSCVMWDAGAMIKSSEVREFVKGVSCVFNVQIEGRDDGVNVKVEEL